MKQEFKIGKALENLSHRIICWSGNSWAFSIATLGIIIWLITGPIFAFSDTWQLVVNTTTSVITFLMVFLIQRAQNKDSRAVHLKLNEIVAAMDGASNRLVDIENLSEHELQVLHKFYAALAEMAKRDTALTKSHSIDEAAQEHNAKLKANQK